MSILNTFFILFKSNSEDVIKGNKAIEKSSKDTERALKDTNEEAKSLGESFVKIVESGAAAAGAWAGFKILENGVKNATDYNAQLAITAKIYGQLPEQIKKFNQAAAEAGGTREGANAELIRMFELATKMGFHSASPDQTMEFFRKQLAPFAPNSAQRLNQIKNIYGFQDPGVILRLLGTKEEFDKNLSSAESVSKLTPDDAKKALDFRTSQEHLAGAEDHLFSTISNELIPKINSLVDKISGLLNSTAGSGAGSLAAGGALIAGNAAKDAGLLWFGSKILKSFFKKGATTATEAAAGSAFEATNFGGAGLAGAAGAAGAGIGTVASLGGIFDYLAFKSFDHTLFKPLIENALVKYYSKDFQTANLTAAMKNVGHLPFSNKKVENDVGDLPTKEDILNSPAAMKDLERAIGKSQRSIESAKSTLNSVSQFNPGSLGGGATTVKIDKIEINTQATDAMGIASEMRNALNSTLSFLGVNFDDGQNK